MILQNVTYICFHTSVCYLHTLFPSISSCIRNSNVLTFPLARVTTILLHTSKIRDIQDTFSFFFFLMFVACLSLRICICREISAGFPSMQITHSLYCLSLASPSTQLTEIYLTNTTRSDTTKQGIYRLISYFNLFSSNIIRYFRLFDL
jgi:hypothetical protein